MSKPQKEESAFHTAARAPVTLSHLYISRKPGVRAPPEEVACLFCLAGHGIVGDRLFDQDEEASIEVTFFPRETFDSLCAAAKANRHELAALRCNVVIEGVDLRQLPGKEFEIHGVRFKGTRESPPGPGLRAQILCDGWLRRGPAELIVWTC